MSRKSLDVTPQLHEYILAHSLREHPALAALREETAKVKHSGMQIGPEQGQFMALLVQLLGARNTIEVGVYTGYSSLAVALALPGDGRVVACDVSEEWTAIGRRYWEKAGVAHKIDLRLGAAARTLDQLLREGGAGRYDFAFIDADKPNYAKYYEQCLQLVRSGGLIAIDNTLWSGTVADPDKHDADTDAIRALNDALHRDARVALSLLPIGDGLTLALRK